ncbi:MAG: phage major capsid protein, partial [Anaerotignum sp.]|nr:phage major capsid protein [Anaerotignum sp.]
MALKTLLLRSKLDAKKKELESLRAKDADFETREAELEAAIGEMTEETSAEDRAEVERQTEEFQTEKDSHNNAKGELEAEVERLENEIAEEEHRSAVVAKSNPKKEERGAEHIMETRKFFGMNTQERDAFFAREDVKDFLQRTRAFAGQKRAVTGAELTIPEVMLNLVRENIAAYSKLISKVNLKQVPGSARQPIMGTIPEGIWVEMCGKLNEIDFTFTQVEVDGYKVGGFVAIPNAILEDNDVALATELLAGIGQALGLALDKAIIFGTGVKMPTGIFGQLPSTNKATITAANSTDAKLFKEIIKASGNAKSEYSKGGKFWAMSEKTKTTLLAEAVSFTAAGAIASGVNGTMPVIGGDIVTLSFMPDNVIVGGYGDMYLLAERAGAKLGQSEHVMFIEDNT